MYALNLKNIHFYPNGFNVTRFFKIIESQKIWTKMLGRPELSAVDMIYKVSIKESEI